MWRYWSRMIARRVLHWPKKYFVKQYESFFFWDKCSHLAIYLRLMETHYNRNLQIQEVLVN